MPDPLMTPEQAQALRDAGHLQPDTYSKLVPEPSPTPEVQPSAPEASPPPAATPVSQPEPASDPFAGAMETAQKKIADDKTAAADKEVTDAAEKLPKLREELAKKTANMLPVHGEAGTRQLLTAEIGEIQKLERLAGSRAAGGSIQPAMLSTGGAPASTPNPNVVLASDVAPAPTGRGGTPGTAVPGFTSGYDMMAAGVRQASQTGQAKAAEAAAMQERIQKEDLERLKGNEAAEAQRQARMDDELKKLDAESQRIGTLKVDQDRLWKSRDTGDKVMAGIGLVLGAFGSGGNKGVKVITDAIDRDIAAQKADIQTQKDAFQAKSGVYSQMVAQFRDKRAAEEATRLAYLNNAEMKIKEIEARYSGPEIKAKAQQALGEIQVKKDEARAAFAKAMRPLMQDPGSGMANPELMTQEQRDRFVPGYGLALTKDDASKLKESVANTSAAKDTVRALAAIGDMPGKSTDPELRTRASSLVSMLQGQMRTEILGPGAVTDKERELLDKIVANPTEIFRLDSTAKAALNTLTERLDRNLAAKVQTYGLRSPAAQVNFVASK